jgi:hypothetical protein
MKKLLLASLLLTTVVIAGVRVDFALNPEHRTGVFKGLCDAGLPNLSRPPEVDADSLGCAILGPKRTVTAFLELGFEHSHIIIGDRYEWDDLGVTNEVAWFSDTPGLRDRGGDALLKLHHDRRDGCFVTVSRVSVEGWMTVSEGNFGHLGLASREFYAGRILSSKPATVEDLKGAHGMGDMVCPAGMSDTEGNAASDPTDEARIGADDGVEEVVP